MDARPLAHQREQVHLGLRASRDADHRDASAGSERIEVLGEVRRADQLEDDVERTVPGKIRGRDHLRAELRDRLAQRGVSYRRRRAGARRERDLYRRGADATRPAVYEQALPGPQACLREDRVVRRGEHLRKAARRHPVELARRREQRALVHHRELRLAAAADDPHHTLA